MFKFVLLFLALVLPSYWLLSQFTFLNYVAAYSSAFVLEKLFSVPVSVVSGLTHPFLSLDGLLVEIIDLCSGKIEIALLFAFLFASFEKPLAYRLKGFLAGVLLVFLFNAFRIALTVNFLASNNLKAASVFHDVLFRISLVLFLVTFYAVWYYADKPRTKTNRPGKDSLSPKSSRKRKAKRRK